jgi:hypothetical protein
MVLLYVAVSFIAKKGYNITMKNYIVAIPKPFHFNGYIIFLKKMTTIWVSNLRPLGLESKLLPLGYVYVCVSNSESTLY